MRNRIKNTFITGCLTTLLVIVGSFAMAAEYTVTVDDVTVVEGNDVQFDVTISPALEAGDNALVLSWSTSPGSATDPEDYTGATGTLTFNTGETTKQTTAISTVDDSIREGTHSFMVTVSLDTCGGGAGCTLAAPTSTGTGYLDDNDHNITVTANTSEIELVGNYGFTIAVDPAITGSEEIVVNYSTSDGTASSASDYTGVLSSITFTSTLNSQLVNVAITDDSEVESDETFDFEVSVSSGSEYVYDQDSSTTGTIRNNDHDIVVGANSSEDEGITDYPFDVRIVPPIAATESYTVGVLFGTFGISATSGTDFTGTPTPSSFTFDNSNDTVLVQVAIDDDTVIEPDEEFELVQMVDSGTEHIRNYDGSVSATILDNDSAAIYFVPASVTVAIDEQASGYPTSWTQEYTVELAPGTTFEGTEVVAVSYSTVAGTATEGNDYTGTSGTIFFDKDSATNQQTISVTILDDNIREAGAPEQFTIELTAVDNANVTVDTSTTTITDNDNIFQVVNDLEIDEEDTDVTTFTVPILALPDTDRPMTIGYEIVAGTATAGADYEAGPGHSLSGTITIAGGDPNPYQLPITILADSNPNEADETFTVRLVDLSWVESPNAKVDPAEQEITVTIIDHDYEVSVEDVSVSEDAGTASFNVAITPTPKDSDVVEVTWEALSATGDTAVSPDDFTAATGTVYFYGPDHASGPQYTQEIDVAITDDNIAEIYESYTVRLTGASINAYIADNTAVGGITDDDYGVASFGDITVNESDGTTVRLPVRLNRVVAGSSPDITFDVTDVTVAEGGSATVTLDYNLDTATLIFSSGEIEKEIALTIIDDDFVELAETIVLQLTNSNSPQKVLIDATTTPDYQATVTIAVDDRFEVSVNDPTPVEEADTVIPFTVTVSPTPDADDELFTIDYTTADWEATAGASPGDPDYDATSGTISVASGVADYTVNVTINDDAVNEGIQERFFLDLSNPVVADIVTVVDPQGIGTILDVPYVVTPSWLNHGEITLESPPGTPVAISNGSAVGIQDNTDAVFTVAADYEITRVVIDGVEILENDPVPATVSSAGIPLSDYVTKSDPSDAVHEYTFLDATTPDGGHTIYAEFDHKIDMTASGPGSVEAPADPAITVVTVNPVHNGGPEPVFADHGSSHTFTITPDGGQCVTDVLVDGSSIGAFSGAANKSSADVNSITDNRTIEGQFGTATITVLLGADDGLTGSDEDLEIQIPANSSGWRAYVADSSYAYDPDVSGTDFIMEGDHGESFTIPDDMPAGVGCDARYIVITYFDVDGWLKPTDDYLDLNYSFKDQTVEGLYDANSHVLELVFVNGTITIDPIGDPAVGDNRYIYTADTDVVLTPVPDVGWYFHGWDGDASGTDSPLTVTMSSDKTVEALFVQGCQDADNDGYMVDPGDGSCDFGDEADCNDNNSSIHPGAEEICGDGIDQDCSGGDLACTGDDSDDDGDGFTENQGDCDDTDITAYPGAIDIPGDGVDQDCFDGDKLVGTELTCVDPTDIPANASRKPAPPMIMFLLDDSGSMDWEFMTSASNQLYESRYFIYEYHDESRAYSDNRLSDAQRKEWLSQWAGENRIFFNPNVTYDPWPMWDLVAASIPAGEYDGSEEMLVRPHEFSYDTDNATFPDIAFKDGYVHADMDQPRNNTLDSDDGHSWSYIADDGTVGRHIINLNDEFFTVKGAEVAGQQVIVTRDSESAPNDGDTRADAIGLSIRNDLQLNDDHYWTWYDASNSPELIYDNQDGSDVFSRTDNWIESGGTADWEWQYSLLYTENDGEFATWRLNMNSTEAAAGDSAGGYYIYAWIDDWYNSDTNAKYTIHYYDGDDLVTEDVRVNQQPDNPPGGNREGPRWILLNDKRYQFKEQASSAADISVKNAHYFTWSDTDGDGERDLGEIYLINIPGTGHNVGDYTLEYYQFNDLNGNDSVDDGELLRLTDAADYAAVKPKRYNEIGDEITDDDQLAYIVRQNFADWYSFYRRRILTAKAAVGLTVEEMKNVELGVHTINRTYHEPLVLMENADGTEKIEFLKTVYNINPNGSTYLRRGLDDVGRYFDEGDSGDYSNLHTSEGLPSGDDSVFWDAKTEDDADDIDDSGGECQRAYVIAMTDGYYNQSFSISNQDGSSYYALRDGTSNTLADIAHKYYHMDMDSGLDNLVPQKGFDDAAHQHMVTFGVSFGVFGSFDPDLFPDCLPACDTPGENGCPALDQIGKVDDCITNGDGDLECRTCTEDSGGDITCSTDRTTGPFDNMCPEWHSSIGSENPRTVDDLYHAAVNGRGEFLNAADPSELVESMKAIKDLIEEDEGTASSVSINANKIEANTLLYQTSYDSSDWSGDVKAKCLDMNGDLAHCDAVDCSVTCDDAYDSCLDLCTIGDEDCEAVCLTTWTNCYDNNNCNDYLLCGAAHTVCVDNCNNDATCESACGDAKETCLEDPPEVKWSAEEQLDGVSWSSRQIITADASGNGLPFRWPSLTTSMKTMLNGDSRELDYIRGDHSCEEGNATGCLADFRVRVNTLGDFINSEPYYYENETLAIDYVLAGANDGMLHVFDSSSGDELFSYIPSPVFENLTYLTEPGYTDSHKFFVDGYVAVEEMGDVVLMVGGLGKGGKGFYALDLARAKTAMTVDTVENDAADIVKWEYTSLTTNAVAKAPTDSEWAVWKTHIGYSFSRPQIIPSNDTSDGAEKLLVFGNGYDSDSGRAVLFLVGLDSMGDIVWTHIIDTGVGDNSTAQNNCNGLSSPAIIYPQGDGNNDYLYAGDLLGNMWKFDISNSDRNNWSVYFSDGTNPKPLFSARSEAGWRQPITMQPDVAYSCVNGTSGYLVAFGTGRLYNPEVDNLDFSVQTMYGIYDWSDEWVRIGETGSDKYLGEFEGDNTSVTASCSSTCSSIASTCESNCLSNTECILECIEEESICISNCSAVRNLSNMDAITGDAASADYVGLLQQIQISVNGIIYNSDGTIRSQEYGETNLNEVDEVVRTMSDNEIEWLIPGQVSDFVAETGKVMHHVGWYFDLPANGERAVKDVTIASGNLIFTSSKPSDTPCSGGGTSTIWVADVCSGARNTYAYFDLNKDGVIDHNDYINIGTEANPIYVPPSGFNIDGISPAPTLVEVDDHLDKLYFPESGGSGGDGGDGGGLGGIGAGGYGVPLLYWRELDWQ